jgi:hypothetical protein
VPLLLVSIACNEVRAKKFSFLPLKKFFVFLTTFVLLNDRFYRYIAKMLADHIIEKETNTEQL